MELCFTDLGPSLECLTLAAGGSCCCSLAVLRRCKVVWKIFLPPAPFIPCCGAGEPDFVTSLAVDLSLESRLGDDAADLLLEFVEFVFVSCERRARISRERCDRKLFFTNEDDEFELTLAVDAVRLIPLGVDLMTGPSFALLGPLGLRLFLVNEEFLLATVESLDFGPFGRSLNMIGLDLEYTGEGLSRFVFLVLKYS